MLGGYYRGLLDEILDAVRGRARWRCRRCLLAMLLLTTVGANPIYVALGIAVVFMPRSARVLRGVALRLAASEFIDAARVRGERGPYIIFHEMLPNAWAPITVGADHPVRLRDPPRHVPRASWAWAPSRPRPTGGS